VSGNDCSIRVFMNELIKTAHEHGYDIAYCIKKHIPENKKKKLISAMLSSTLE